MLKPVRIVAPAASLVSLSEARSALRIDSAEEDGLISDLIAAVETMLDGWSGILGRCIAMQTWRYSVAALQDTRLPFPDVRSAVVRYLDLDGIEQVLPESSYRLLNEDAGGLLELVADAELPDVYQRIDAVRIEAVYGMDPVPEALKRAVLIKVGHLYRAREGGADASPAFDDMIAPFRHRHI